MKRYVHVLMISGLIYFKNFILTVISWSEEVLN